jgi:hypothetical protein
LVGTSVGLRTDYRIDGRGSIPVRDKDFSLFHCVGTGCRFHPASYSMGTEEFFNGIKRPGSETEHSPPSRAVVKNGGAILPITHTHS